MIRVYAFGGRPNDLRDTYLERAKRLMPFEWTDIPLKKCPDRREKTLLPEEQNFLKKQAQKSFYLLDSDGNLFKNSSDFSQWLFRQSELSLVLGPAIGFHPEFYAKAKGKLSLSPLTFTHGLAQCILAECLYRAVCELKNHPFVK